MDTSCVKLETGVDAQNAATFIFEDGCMASMHSSMLGGTEQAGIVYGDKGYLIAWNINDVDRIQVFDNSRKLIREMETPEQIPDLSTKYGQLWKLYVREKRNARRCLTVSRST